VPHCVRLVNLWDERQRGPARAVHIGVGTETQPASPASVREAGEMTTRLLPAGGDMQDNQDRLVMEKVD